MTIATVTAGTLAGYAFLVIGLLCCAAAIWFGISERGHAYSGSTAFIVGGLIAAFAVVGAWWWGMAFTTSADYHSWTVKEGMVQDVSKRLIATDNGMSERFVVRVNGSLYGVDDTRASLLKKGDDVSLRCKKDYQWGVPREAHGWACRWNG